MSEPTRRVPVTAFALVSTPAGAHAVPADVDFTDALAMGAPDTVGAALARAGRLDLAHPPPLDNQDHWVRTQLPALGRADEHALVFEGLATLAEIWVNGSPQPASRSMFVAHEIVLGDLCGDDELVLCFRALAPELARRRPRPRWRTRLIDGQQLRFVRTSFLGRMPGLGPSLPVVGPYRSVYLEARTRFRLRAQRLVPDLGARALHAEITLELLGDADVEGAQLEVRGEAGAGSAPLAITSQGRQRTLRATVSLSEVRAWWPHTHGGQPLSEVVLRLDDGSTLPLGRVGLRSVELDRGADGRGFGLIINGVPVFARGACFTTNDFLTLGESGLRALLTMTARAGMNMLRVPGITCYPPRPFHDLCDELGLMVFQEFMFANLDYPAGDPEFDRQVDQEARQLLTRIGAQPSTVVLCGGSEVAQQAAMLGMPEDTWRSPLFEQTLAALARELSPGALYVPHSPSGGALPFHVSEGISHYYGVGAYLRPLDDLRRSQVRFAAECLAFANVPQQESIERFMRDLEMPFHHPRWKQRVPRDRGVGWDFEDVRDHYVASLFGVDVRELRAREPERYLALGHAAVGETITAAFSEWRSQGSSCRGALLFWLKDLWTGAGFGLIDAEGLPKSAYYYAARAFAARHVVLTDEGLNGLRAHVGNESDEDWAVTLQVVLFRDGEIPVVEGRQSVRVPERATLMIEVDGLLPRFADTTYAYRFGPPAHDLVVATLKVGNETVGRAFHLPLGFGRAPVADLGLRGTLARAAGGAWLTVETRAFAQCVRVEVPGFLPDDDYFHLGPGERRRIWLTARDRAADKPRGSLYALNARSPSVLTAATPAPGGLPGASG